jgi:hypothetical protein
MKITLHIGAPRTGSTSIQQTFDAICVDSDNAIFISPRQRRNKLESLLCDFCHIPNFQPIQRLHAGKVLKAIQSLPKKIDHLIISEENIAGKMLGLADRQFARAKAYNTLLRVLSQHHQCKTLIFVREQMDYIKSCYKFRVERGYKYPLTDFVNSLELQALSWIHGIKHISPDHLTIVDFDSFFNNAKFDKSSLPFPFGEHINKKSNASFASPFRLEFLRQYALLTDSHLDDVWRIRQYLAAKKGGIARACKHIYSDSPVFDECFQNTIQEKEKRFPSFRLPNSVLHSLKHTASEDVSALSSMTNAFGDFEGWLRQ